MKFDALFRLIKETADLSNRRVNWLQWCQTLLAPPHVRISLLLLLNLRGLCQDWIHLNIQLTGQRSFLWDRGFDQWIFIFTRLCFCLLLGELLQLCRKGTSLLWTHRVQLRQLVLHPWRTFPSRFGTVESVCEILVPFIILFVSLLLAWMPKRRPWRTNTYFAARRRQSHTRFATFFHVSMRVWRRKRQGGISGRESQVIVELHELTHVSFVLQINLWPLRVKIMHCGIQFTPSVRCQWLLWLHIVRAASHSFQHRHSSYGVEHFLGLSVFLLLYLSIDVLLLRKD